MPTARKLPSGSWNCIVFSHYEYVDGKKKRKYESFTCDDPSKAGKKECERMAAEWSYKRNHRLIDMTVYNALEEYVNSKVGVLSPATVRGYERYRNNYFHEIESLRLKDLDQITLQTWISNLSKDKDAKTVRNAWGLLRPTLTMFNCGPYNLTLPRKDPAELYTPTDQEVAALLDKVKDAELKLAIMLAAYGSLRRSEICALTANDITSTGVIINKAMVQDKDKQWVIKEPKSRGSIRHADLPETALTLARSLPPDRDGRIIHCTPQALERRFQRAVDGAEIPHFRFHDLRHYYVSISHALGIPEEYTMHNGGWVHGSRIMREIYRDRLSDQEEKNRSILRDHFKAVQNEMQNGAAKMP